MAKTISDGSGLYVETYALREDANKWSDAAKALSFGETVSLSVFCVLPAEKGNDALVKAVELLRDYYFTYGQQGVDEFVDIGKSLKEAAADYERTEQEVF